MEDFKDTPPPAPLSSIRLKFHGATPGTPMLAEEVANRDAMEEEGGEGLVGAEHAVTQRVDKPAKRRRLFPASAVKLEEELVLARRQGLRNAGKPSRGEGEGDNQTGRG